VLNIADMRTRHSRRGLRLAAPALRRQAAGHGEFRQSIAYAESAERALSILDYRPDLAVDYLDVADEPAQAARPADARRKLKALR